LNVVAFQLPELDEASGTMEVHARAYHHCSASHADMLLGNFWEQAPSFWDTVATVGLRNHYVTSHYAFPLMKHTAELCRKQGLKKTPAIVQVSSFGGLVYSYVMRPFDMLYPVLVEVLPSLLI
jgi:NAD(P)-dependent dehydrogenase (short-subunit alcohol dehydrogenase family)